MKIGHLENAPPADPPGTGKPSFVQTLATLRAWFWPGLFIVVATLAAYWPVYSAGFIWDDDAYVTENPLLTAPHGFWHIWFSAHFQSQYFPLVFSTLRLEYDCWGLNPLGYHLVNVCLHIVNALLVWVLLRRLALPGAWLAAALFALHPVQVETVAWITELKNTESTLFYLLAVFAWLRFCGGKSWWFYALALGLHALALFAKTTACTLPAALLLVLWLKNEPVNCRRILQALPFLLLGVGMGLLSVWWEKHLGNYSPKLHLLGGPVERLLIATHALWFYAGKIFWPANLTFSYPRWEINAADPRQYVWLAGGLAAVAALWFGRRKFGWRPVIAVTFFVAALSPMLGFIPLYTFYYSYVADHYQYFACLGLLALAAGAAAVFLERRQVRRWLQRILAVALLATLGVLTFQQCLIYKDVETLWTDTLRKNPHSWLAHTNLGRKYLKEGRLDEAEKQYLATIEIVPEQEDIRYNYGNLLARERRYDDAVAQYRLALQINPAKADAHNNLGFVLNRMNRTDEAITEYERAILCQPDYADAYFNLGNALSAEHKMEAAIMAYRQALVLAPDSDRVRKRLQALGALPN
jgi:tetratricopeptide (TPR) repeat protein